jgi:tripartite-type tricarboxylate transporter receptor subunit TctC
VPAVAEFIPGFDFASRIGVFAGAGTSDTIADLISTNIIAIAGEEQTIARFAAVGIEAAGSRPNEFKKVLDDEIARVAATVKLAGIESQ